jgi:recombination protein RecT
MAETQVTLKTNSLAKLKGILNNETMQQNFRNILAENAGAFMASIIELYQSDGALQKCDPNRVVLEALKAATLKLPINKQLGFAYIIPYNNVPTFQLGFRGLIQLAQRSGQYRYINADVVCEGELVNYNRITGMLEISGTAKSETPVGYFAYFQLLNGFEKCVYWTREKVEAHAKRYSKAWSKADSPWHTNFDAMALKTVLKTIISKYGVMSVEFANTIANDSVDDRIEAEVAQNANGQPIVLPTSAAPALEAALVHEAAAPAAPPAAAVIYDEDMDPGF